MKILIDMDNTLFYFTGATRIKYEWSPPEMWVPGFFENLKPTEGSHAAIATLMKIHDVYICTKPLALSPISYTEKVNSITKHFPVLLEKIIMIQDKGMIKADILIDDEQHNIEAFDGIGILFDSKKDHKKQWEHVLYYVNLLYGDNK